MLENMCTGEIEGIIETLRKCNLYEYVLLEASGTITPENIREYATTGIDIVSLGCLTHSTKVLDMSLEMSL